MSYSFFSSIDGVCVIMEKFGFTGEQEREFSTMKEIKKLMYNGHADPGGGGLKNTGCS